MTELLRRISGGELIGLVSVGGGLLVAVTAIIATQWRRARVVELEGILKQQMLDKGMSAAEIEQVLNAGQGSSCIQKAIAGNKGLDKAGLVQSMMDNGYEGKDIERVLRAYQTGEKNPDENAIMDKA